MIKVTKPSAVPTKLSGAGAAATLLDQADYDADQRAYNTNKKRFAIDPGIYGHASVKSALKKAQHNKCCYCEKDQCDEYGAVEHYRPKAGRKSARKKPLAKPGYYWCGYTWGNLYFVCGPCNTHKGNLFPLVDESRRAKSHHDDILREDAYILDPGGAKDPRDHIVFDKELVRGTDDYGKHTIECCRLNRSTLNEKRKKLLSDLEFHIVKIVSQQLGPTSYPANDVRRSRAFLKKSRSAKGEFSAAAADYLSSYNIQ